VWQCLQNVCKTGGETMPDELENTLESDLVTTINKMVVDQQTERLHSFTSLLNTFNYAVQVQSKRPDWNAEDFRLFAIALIAMNKIGVMHPTHNSHAKSGVV
jgi:hypothetical protein